MKAMELVRQVDGDGGEDVDGDISHSIPLRRGATSLGVIAPSSMGETAIPNPWSTPPHETRVPKTSAPIAIKSNFDKKTAASIRRSSFILPRKIDDYKKVPHQTTFSFTTTTIIINNIASTITTTIKSITLSLH